MMHPKYRLAAVSYLNTKPLLYGIVHQGLETDLEMELNIPSVCAKKLVEGEVDLGLVPVAVIPQLAHPHIISDYCIGTEGAVRTVAIFSDVPIEEVQTIYLDFHSRTSVQLCRILCTEYWHIQPTFLPTQAGFTEKIEGTTAALVIGDRTIPLENQHPYMYDLGQAWLEHTGLPFVFAAWVSNHPLDKAFVKRFNEALRFGVENIRKLSYLLPKPHPNFDLQTYFRQNISYHLDAPKRKALSLFLQKIEARAVALG